ncbi:F1-ATP synthase, delta subunit [gamma proteobacterium HdN1]|nr:F1-ATP synthase, delta subunit [gamma proteobacterium HdN1]
MAELTTVARPYAKAAFQYAQEQGALNEWSAMLAFTSAAVSEPIVASIVENPAKTAQQQADVLVQLCSDAMDSTRRNFIALVAKNKRLSALPAIAELYESYKAELEKTVDVEVTSAFELDPQHSESLSSALQRRLGRGINLSTVVDPSLIGGVIIRAGDMVIDGSVKGKLAKLAEKLNS